ncbi:MAG TPA: TIGR03668 family PPOX class F420-dependent oxidoreductase [Ktedonobacteraceae bacterium]
MTKRSKLLENESAFISRQRVARLATADEQGSPHLVPVCYAFDQHYFYTPLDEKPKSVTSFKLRRVRNIEARHEASLLVDQYNDDWGQLGYVLIHGTARLIEANDELHEHAIKLLRSRYQQYRTMNLEKLPIIVITPDHISSWGPAIQTAEHP